MTNRRHIAALLCVVLVLALAVSSAFIVHEAGHDCAGNGCPICRMIAVHMDLLRAMGLAVLILLALFFLLRGKFARREPRRFSLPVSGTLVSWKIRLNN